MAVYPQITEVDNIILNSTTISTPTAFIPITSTRGVVGKSVLISGGDLAEFVDTFGSVPSSDHPEMWIYAYKLIEAGMPCLVMRIAEGTPIASYATFTEDDSEEPPVAQDMLTVTANTVGTWLNDYKISITPIAGTSTQILTYVMDSNNNILETLNISMLSTDSNYVSNVSSQYVILTDPRSESGEGSFKKGSAWQPSSVTSQSFASGTNGTSITVATLVGVQGSSLGVLDEIKDKLQYSFSYLTSGGYIDSETITSTVANATALNNKLIEVAEFRKDCLALIEVPNFVDPENVVIYVNAGAISGVTGTPSTAYNSSYSAAFNPWASYVNPVDNSVIWMVPSLGYLLALSRSQIANPIWFAAAGTERGRVPEIISLAYTVDSSTLDTWQGDQGIINPIMTINRYGVLVYGNRTLYRSYGSSLTSINVRLMLNEIKRELSDICINLAFNQYSAATWDKFYSKLNSYLLNIKSNDGISYYSIQDVTTPSDLSNLTMRVRVVITPVRAVEKFDITLVVNSDSVTVL
jgi:hypothetical protein